LHQVGDLFELNVKLRCQKVNVIQFQIYTCVVMNCKKNELMESLIISYYLHR